MLSPNPIHCSNTTPSLPVFPPPRSLCSRHRLNPKGISRKALPLALGNVISCLGDAAGRKTPAATGGAYADEAHGDPGSFFYELIMGRDVLAEQYFILYFYITFFIYLVFLFIVVVCYI